VTRHPLVRWSGLALGAGGALTVLLNAILTPLLPRGAPFADVAASTTFALRQGFSGMAGVLLLIGTIGLYLKQADTSGWPGGVAFTLAFVGSTLLVAHEWSEAFVIRDLALRAPEALRSIESAGRFGLRDLAAMAALLTFTLGWLALAASTYRSVPAARRGAELVFAGFIAVPILGASLPGPWGAVAGSAVLGTGWVLLGAVLWRGTGTDGPNRAVP
jgi:hypothetical protein